LRCWDIGDVEVGSRWRFEGIYQYSPCLSAAVRSGMMIDDSPIDARRGLRAGCIVDKVATELSELVVCCIVMSFGRQGIVV
jgi:hypothetical protein